MGIAIRARAQSLINSVSRRAFRLDPDIDHRLLELSQFCGVVEVRPKPFEFFYHTANLRAPGIHRVAQT